MAASKYVPGYEVNDVSPFPRYYEEILPHLSMLDQIGFRGDHYFVFYSKNRHGQALYEVNEKKKSAEATYQRLFVENDRNKYFREIKELLKEVKAHLDAVNSTSYSELSDEELGRLIISTYEIESRVFTYFIACQPHRTVLFEDEVKAELRKRVAVSRVDAYLTELAVSEKPTQMGLEEVDWIKLLIANHDSIGQIQKASLETLPETLKDAVLKHFHKYKLLTLGDGTWTYDINFFIRRLEERQKSLAALQERLSELCHTETVTLRRRQDLIRELYLAEPTIKTVELLADLGYYRFMLRTDGFVPLIFAGISMRREIGRRAGMKDDLSLFYLKPEEFKAFLAGKLHYTDADGNERRGADDEFIYYIDNGEPHLLFGTEAGRKFLELAPPEDTSGVTEVTGSPAMRGCVQGKVSLYRWGDDMHERLESMENNKILVAGHTRPAMMPLIRKAVGIVTDEGGVTSHAAIVSRELGLPSVINTGNATKVFKEGDLVELDADHGVVRKIQ